MRNRQKQRANRKLKPKEERIDIRNAYGYKDPTAYLAVKNIVSKEATIAAH